MGREARCACRWGDREGHVTALLESDVLIVRGDIRGRARRSTLEQICVRGDALEFTAAGERVRLTLGAVAARRWAEAIAAPPPTLARKLGITSTTRLNVIGTIDDDALFAAFAGAAELVTSLDSADLAIVRTDNPTVLETYGTETSRMKIPPTWIVYHKGRNAPLGESRVREIMLRCGFIDTKVAAVSERLTALRFSKVRKLCVVAPTTRTLERKPVGAPPPAALAYERACEGRRDRRQHSPTAYLQNGHAVDS